ncbi:hypothetical protein HDZ31DRAFT_70792, partial [Schizophyllum fasciatum]
STPFRPFVDSEPAPQSQKKRTKLTPFVDPENAHSRAALGSKDTSVSSENNPFAPTKSALKTKGEETPAKPSDPPKPVFTPAGAKPALAPLRESLTDEYGLPSQTRPKMGGPTHERAKSYQEQGAAAAAEEPAQRAPVFFRQPVFAPPGQSENAYTPNAKQASSVFTPREGGSAPRSRLAEAAKSENAFTPKQNGAALKSENAFTPATKSENSFGSASKRENAFTPKSENAVPPRSENAFTPKVHDAAESVFKPKAMAEKPRGAFAILQDAEPEEEAPAEQPAPKVVEIESDEEEEEQEQPAHDLSRHAEDEVNEHLPDDYSGDF